MRVDHVCSYGRGKTIAQIHVRITRRKLLESGEFPDHCHSQHCTQTSPRTNKPHGRPQDFPGVDNEGVWKTEVPQPEADLGMFSMFGRTAPPSP